MKTSLMEEKLMLRLALSCHKEYVRTYGFPTLYGFLRGEYPILIDKNNTLLDLGGILYDTLNVYTEVSLCPTDCAPPASGYLMTRGIILKRRWGLW